MKLLLAAGLALPLVGATATVVVAWLLDVRRGRWAGVTAAVLAAAAWAIVVSAETPPEIGRIEAHPVPAAALAGLSLLIAARLPRTSLAASSSLCAVTVFAAASTTGLSGWPDRPLALGVAVLVLLVAARLRAEEVPGVDVVALAAGGAALTVGLLLSAEGSGAALVVAGAATAMVVAVRCGTALLLMPVTLYAVARATDAAHAIGPDEGDLVAGAGIVAALVATAAIHLSRRFGSGRGLRSRAQRIPLVAAATVAVVLLAQDPVGFRSAGALLAAGAVLAATTTRPLALVACLPGAVAGVEVFGEATDPVHAAAGATCAAALIGALTVTLAPAGSGGHRAWTLPAVAFAVIPLWGWTGAGDAGYTDAVAVSLAAGSVAALGVVVGRSLPSGEPGLLGKLRGRPSAPTHGKTNPRAEEADPRQVDRDIASALDW